MRIIKKINLTSGGFSQFGPTVSSPIILCFGAPRSLFKGCLKAEHIWSFFSHSWLRLFSFHFWNTSSFFLLLLFSFISYSLVSFLFNFNSDKAFCPEMKTNVVSYTSMIESSSCHFLCQGKEGEGSCWPTRPSRRPAARPTWSRWPPRGSPSPPPSASCYSSPSAGLILTPDQSQRPSKS